MPEPSAYFELLKQTLAATIYDESAWRIDQPPDPKPSLTEPIRFIRETIRSFRRWVAIAGRCREMAVVHKDQYDPAKQEVGEHWPLFGYTMVGLKRLNNIQACVEDILARNIPGDLVETGVWRGGATILMRAILKERNITDRLVWAADSFEGLPRPTGVDVTLDKDWDLSNNDFLKVSLEQVQANFRRFNLLDDHVKFLKGWFKDTLPNSPIKQIAVLRLDGDMYHSTMDAINALYDRVSPGGYVIVDDYLAWEGCRRAIDEFRAARHITAPMTTVDWTCVYWQVPPSPSPAAKQAASSFATV